jgi:hypothetical protein
MSSLSLQKQAEKEEYEKSQKVDTIYRIMTNKPKSSRQENRLNNLSIEDCEFICKNKMVKRMMARALETDVGELTELCEDKEKLKKHIDLTLRTIRERESAKKIPIKDLPLKLRFVDLPDDVMIKFAEKLKLLLKYKLRDWIPYDKLDLKWLSANININAIDILKVANPDNLDWKRLAENTSAYEILSDPVNRVRLNKYKNELSGNYDKDVVKFLEANQDLVNLKKLSGNKGASDLLLKYKETLHMLNIIELSRNPGAIKLIEELYKKDPYSPYINWNFLSENPKAIDLLNKNKNKINWSSLSKNPKAIELLRDKIEEEKKLLPTQLAKLHYSEKIDWGNLSSNPNAIKLLRDKIEQENKLSPTQLAKLHYSEKIDWKLLSGNPGAIKLLEEALTKDPDNSEIDWKLLSANPKAIKLLKKNQEKINYQYLSMNPSIFALERWHTGSSPPPFTKNSSSSK